MRRLRSDPQALVLRVAGLAQTSTSPSAASVCA
jgi:hypothetical protein